MMNDSVLTVQRGRQLCIGRNVQSGRVNSAVRATADPVNTLGHLHLTRTRTVALTARRAIALTAAGYGALLLLALLVRPV
jgi:hypothetical protein